MSLNNVFSDRWDPVKILLLLFLVTDATFILLSYVHNYTPFLNNYFWSLDDRGISETFQYIKEYWIVIMLGMLFWHTREWTYGAWTLLYFYLLGDDSMQFHEHGGYAMVHYLGLHNAFGLLAQDFGELIISGAAGLTFLLLIVPAYIRSSQDARNATKDLAVLLMALAFAGVFLDMVHSFVGNENIFLGVLENGGELFAMDLTAWYVFNLAVTQGKVPAALWDVVIMPGYKHWTTSFGHRLAKLLSLKTT